MISVGVGNVCLRTIGHSDIHKLREWRNDYRVWRWCRQNDLISDTDHRNWFDSLPSRKDVKMYLIVDAKDTLEGVGVCGLTSIDPVNRRAEFSLYIDPDKHNEGYGAAALWTLLSHGFLNLGLNSIWGETFDGNHALKMFERLGFKREGTRRQFYFRQGKFIDAHLVSMLASEFLGRDFSRTGEYKPEIAVRGGERSFSIQPIPRFSATHEKTAPEAKANRKRR